MPRDVSTIKRKLEEIQALLDAEPASEQGVRKDNKEPTATGPSDRCVVTFPGERAAITVVIGTSQHSEMLGLVDRISQIVNAAYSAAKRHKRLDAYDVMHRLEMGDDGVRANRVLHMAFQGDVTKVQNLVGCCSSTFQPGWTDEGCGHWGLLAVDPAHQGEGVATALVLAAERRLATGSEMIQIEYEHTEGDQYSDRLMAWYEGKLGFDGGPRGSRRPGRTIFRRCLKEIPEEEQRFGQRRHLEEIRAWLAAQLAEAQETVMVDQAALAM